MSPEAALAEVRRIHRPWRIYDYCDHPHTQEDVDAERAVHVYDVGFVCEDGYKYDICASCCAEGEDFPEYQTEACATSHDHGRGVPICETAAAIEGVSP